MKNIYDNEEFFNAYSQMSRSKDGLTAAGEWHQLRPLFPDLHDKAVLDIGCGYGWHSKYAAEQGAKSVLGFDLSEKMIAKAKIRNADERITYEVCGIEEYAYPKDTYDVAVSNLALHYVADLDAVYGNIYKTLKDDGVFLLNIEHPVFTAGVNEDWIYDGDRRPQFWPVDNYFYAGERQTHFLGQTVTKQHHTLTQIIMGLIRAGFVLEAVEEAQPCAEMMKIPGMKDEMRRPMMLLIRARKPYAR